MRHLMQRRSAADAARLEEAADTMLRQGDLAEAVTTLVRAADLSPAGDARTRRLALAAFHCTGWDPARAERLAESVPRSALSAAARAVVGLYRDGDVDTAQQLINPYQLNDASDSLLVTAIHALRLACRYGDRPQLWPCLEPGHGLEEAIASLDGETDPTKVIEIADAALAADWIGQCRDALTTMIAASRRGGALSCAIQGLLLLGADDLNQGRWHGAREHAADAFVLADGHGFHLFAQTARYELAMVAAIRGDTGEVAAQSEQLLGWATPRRANSIDSLVAQLRTVEASGRGDFDAAYRHATSISSAGKLAAPLYLVDAALRTGRTEEAVAHARALERAGIARLGGRQAMIQYACTAAVTDGPAARRGFERALSVDGARAWTFEHAQVRLMFGAHLGRHGSPVAAREQLGQATATFSLLGARPWDARARAEARLVVRR